MAGALTPGASEHRRATGRPSGAPPWLTTARLRPGGKVDLIAWSSGEVVVEGNARIVPGARVALLLKGERLQRSLRGQVRSVSITAMTRDGDVRYQTSIRFETAVDLGRLTETEE